MQYTVVLEKGDSSYGAFVPDISGCISVGESQEEVLELIKDGIEFHLEGLLEDGFPPLDHTVNLKKLR
ncbi:hypothetical protein SPONL_1887 [uncultured Candidatus Thioglobus sp.]|nr:hypothetical protein SPONL_1887 [uncultured Candidatus Thioglobus sp.]